MAAAKRKAMGKRLRFEVFKRDGFQCTYCGASPQTSVLRVDHVVAVADGGGNEPSNLVTACEACNAGKSSVPLERKALPVGRVTDENRDHAEQIREWLALQREVSAARDEVGDMLLEEWARRCGSGPSDLRSRLPKMLQEVSPVRLVEAFQIVADRKGGYAYSTQIRYLYGILRRWRTLVDAAMSPKPVPPPTPPALSRHAKRCWKAVCSAIDRCRSGGVTGDDLWAAIMEAFASAAWVFPEARTYYVEPEYAYPNPWEYSTSVNGVRITLKDGRVSVADDPDFNPRIEAYEGLESAISLAAYPHNDPAKEMASLYRQMEQWRMLITLLSDPSCEVRSYYARTPCLAEVLVTWTFDDTHGGPP